MGTPCSGPFKRPVAANSSSSLRASCFASSKNTIRRVRQTRADYRYDRVQVVETQAIRTFSEAIRRVLRLRRARNISLQNDRRSPLSSQNILHNLRCWAPQKINPQLELAS